MNSCWKLSIGHAVYCYIGDQIVYQAKGEWKSKQSEEHFVGCVFVEVRAA